MRRQRAYRARIAAHTARGRGSWPMPPGVTTGRMTAWTEEVRNQTFSHIHRKSLTRRLVPVSNPDEVVREVGARTSQRIGMCNHAVKRTVFASSRVTPACNRLELEMSSRGGFASDLCARWRYRFWERTRVSARPGWVGGVCISFVGRGSCVQLQEDEQLRKLVDQLGCKKWSLIASKMQTKASKQVRGRCCCGRRGFRTV